MKKQERLYYTQEGSAYVLKAESKNNFSSVAIDTSFSWYMYINYPSNLNLADYQLNIRTEKRIIPLMSYLAYIDTSNGEEVVNIAAVYYGLYIGSAASFKHQKALMKIFPYVQCIFNTSNNLFNYQLEHDKVLFSNEDFIDTSSPIRLTIERNMTAGFTSIALVAGTEISIPAASYSISVGFLYYEMV